MKKAQMISQVFIYILTIVVFGVILLYGYKSIQGMTNKADMVLLIQLKKEIKNAVEKTDYGSVTKQELSLPAKFNEICFVDLDFYNNAAATDICNPVEEDYRPLVCDSWDDNVQANLFLVKDAMTVDSDYVGNIKIGNTDKYVCIKSVQGKAALRLEGKGRYVELSEWIAED
jgi:hypothetical protein